MNFYWRANLAVLGCVGILLSMFGLAVIFTLATCPVENDPDVGVRLRQFINQMLSMTPFPIIAVVGTVGMTGSVFMCVRSAFGSPRFRKHTRLHLLMASVVASVLTFAPFAVVVLAPR